jgi:hypothetical protein
MDNQPGDEFLNVDCLAQRLADAEMLLCYAAECGVRVDAALASKVFEARIANDRKRWTVPIAAELIAALTELSAKLRPITAETLRSCADDSRATRTARSYKRVAFVLAGFIVPFSLATFATSAISTAQREDVTVANGLAVTLSNELRPPEAVAGAVPPQAAVDLPGTRKGLATALENGATQKEVIQHLQQFAATTRGIHARARQLNFFLAFAIKDPFEGKDWKKLELSPGLSDLPSEATDRITIYQQIRYFAQTVDGLVSISYGAFAACVLPVLYALLGACAYLLRLFEQQLKGKTLTYSDAHLARFVIAGIAGAVVGLFNNFALGQPASVSPLAVAFLVGYAVDVFFAFLEALIQSFNRPRPGAQVGPAGSAEPSRA